MVFYFLEEKNENLFWLALDYWYHHSYLFWMVAILYLKVFKRQTDLRDLGVAFLAWCRFLVGGCILTYLEQRYQMA